MPPMVYSTDDVMIKTQFLFRLREGSSKEAFATHWMRAASALRTELAPIRKQTVSIVRDDLQRAGNRWDGLASTWWEATDRDVLVKLVENYTASIASRTSINAPLSSEIIFVEEINPMNGAVPPDSSPNIIKIVNPLSMKSDMNYDAFSAYWSGRHGTISSRLPNMISYIQNHIHPDFRDVERVCDGVAESWFDSWEDVQAVVRSEALARVREDEPNLIAPGSLNPMVCREFRSIGDRDR